MKLHLVLEPEDAVAEARDLLAGAYGRLHPEVSGCILGNGPVAASASLTRRPTRPNSRRLPTGNHEGECPHGRHSRVEPGRSFHGNPQDGG